MNELQPTVKIDTSYILDLVCFLDLIFSDAPHQMDDQIAYWEEYVTKESAINLRKARKCFPKNHTFVTIILPVLVSDPDLNSLQVSEILASPKFLIANFKKQECFKNSVDKIFKQFINGDCEKVLKLVAPMIKELERGRFKHFWIHERLPLINSKSKEIENYCKTHSIYDEVSKVGIMRPTCDKTIFVLSFYRTTESNYALPQLDLVTHPNVAVQSVVQDVVKTLVPMWGKHAAYKKELKAMKNNKSLNVVYQNVKADYKNIIEYFEENISLATNAYLNEKLGVIQDPYEFLGRYEFGHYKLAVLIYHQMIGIQIEAGQTLDQYIKTVLCNLRIDYIDEQFLDIMNKRV